MGAPRPEITRQVLAMLAEGKKPAQIKAALGLTRGQIAGIRHRAKGEVVTYEVSAERAEDERLLAMLRMRSKGLSAGQIAKKFGETAPVVMSKTHAVLNADIKHSAPLESEVRVRGAYW